VGNETPNLNPPRNRRAELCNGSTMSKHTINLLSVSGGKDSTAMMLHARERGIENVRYVFADTGNEHEDVYTYLEYLEERLDVQIQRVRPDFAKRIAKKREYIANHWANDLIKDVDGFWLYNAKEDECGGVEPEEPENKYESILRPDGWEWIRAKKGISKDEAERHVFCALETLVPTGNPFLDMCIWKGRFPSTKARFCTDELKTIPITQQVVFPILKAGGRVRSWQGVRADESPRRATYAMHERIEFGVWVYRPLLRWTAMDVFAICRKHGVKPNPLYLKGMNRVGCMPCIMCRKDELSEIARRFPDVIERLRRWEEIVSMASKRGSGTFFASVTHDKDSKYKDPTYKTHGIDAAVEWSMTTRGGVQYDLFKATDPIPACSSNYGLCELPENQENEDEA
jgi:3'-phosphoadenosine 5'-phosphosulfate sulfotransferase (PAPS reductase)/FAD synthetase